MLFWLSLLLFILLHSFSSIIIVFLCVFYVLLLLFFLPQLLLLLLLLLFSRLFLAYGLKNPAARKSASLKFIEPALTLEPTQNILKPFHRGSLPMIQINRNVPSALISYPFHLGGFKLRFLEMEQTIEGLSLVISYFNSALPTNDLMKKSPEFLQLE